jgi:HAD superfamily hydrolase (TIGR01509 family)
LSSSSLLEGNEPPNPPFDVLLWDIDGTLIDTTILITAALDHIYLSFLGKTWPTERIRGIIGIPLAEQVRALGEPEEFGADPAAMVTEFIRYYESHKDLESIVQVAIDALIAAKRQGNRTALVTSKNRDEIANTLPRLGVLEYVDTIVCADDVSNPKPDPESVILALSRLRISPYRALFIGDTVHDMRAGRAAGTSRCAVTWGAGPRVQLLAEHPEFVCDDPLELRPVLGL